MDPDSGLKKNFQKNNENIFNVFFQLFDNFLSTKNKHLFKIYFFLNIFWGLFFFVLYSTQLHLPRHSEPQDPDPKKIPGIRM